MVADIQARSRGCGVVVVVVRVGGWVRLWPTSRRVPVLVVLDLMGLPSS